MNSRPRFGKPPRSRGVLPAYRRSTWVGSGGRRPCCSWRSYAPAAVEAGGRAEFSGRPVAAFCKHAATTCRSVLGQLRARPLAENSIVHGGAWSGWRPGERAGREAGEVVDAAGRPLGETAGETGRAGRRPGTGCGELRWCSGPGVP